MRAPNDRWRPRQVARARGLTSNASSLLKRSDVPVCDPHKIRMRPPGPAAGAAVTATGASLDVDVDRRQKAATEPRTAVKRCFVSFDAGGRRADGKSRDPRARQDHAPARPPAATPKMTGKSGPRASGMLINDIAHGSSPAATTRLCWAGMATALCSRRRALPCRDSSASDSAPMTARSKAIGSRSSGPVTASQGHFRGAASPGHQFHRGAAPATARPTSKLSRIPPASSKRMRRTDSPSRRGEP